MPVKDLHGSAFDDATLTKLRIFEQYVSEWLPTFIHGYPDSPIFIVDFFAGSGSDAMGASGSPLLIFDVIEKFSADILKKQAEIHIILNELDIEKFNNLSENIKDKMSRIGKLSPFVHCSCFNEDFGVLFDRLKDMLKEESCFLFMDQNGVKQIDQKVILDLEEFKRTDYMFFISSSYFRRFANESSFKKLNVDLSDTRTNDIHREILNKYRSMIPNGSMTRLFPFSLKKKSTGHIYGLIFGSKHLLAVEKFMRVAWTESPSNGEANFDIDNDQVKQLEFDFMGKKVTKIDMFFQNLKSFCLSKKEFTNEDVLIYSLENGFPVKIAKECLRDFKKSGFLEPFSHAKVGYNQAVKQKDIVVFKVKE